MSTSEITEEERQGAQHLASLMNLALGSAAGDVGSHQQEAQAAQEARVRGLLSSAAGAGGDGESSATESEGDSPEADRRSLPAMMMPAELKTEVYAADAFVTPPLRRADANHTSAVKRAMERALPKGKGLDINDIVRYLSLVAQGLDRATVISFIVQCHGRNSMHLFRSIVKTVEIHVFLLLGLLTI